MGNLISYITEDCSQSFAERKMNAVDSLVLSQLVYLYFESFLDSNSNFEKSLEDIWHEDEEDKLYEGTRTPKKNATLFQAVTHSPRFKDIKLGHYVNEIDEEQEKQFSAVTFKIEENFYYVAYRGTDTSNVGWKEDFNMTYMSSVPAQISAVEYYEDIARQYPHAKFILGGHSKGGNLAVYTASLACDTTRWQLEAIYNHDGPGFRSDMLEFERFEQIKHLIHKTVPQFPFFGFFLEQYEDYDIVKSKEFTIFQHDPFSWEVDNGDFVLHPEISELVLQIHKNLNQWMKQTDDGTKKVFVDAMYSFIPDEDEESPIENLKYIFNTIRTEDPIIKQTVLDTFSALLNIITDDLKEGILQKLPTYERFSGS